MISELNLSLLEGRLTREPELTYTNSGQSVCKFDIAVNYYFKKDEETQQVTDFLSINCWNKLAENCQRYLQKGSKVRVKGRLRKDSWVSEEGTKKQKTYIQADRVDFLGHAHQKKTNESIEQEKIPY